MERAKRKRGTRMIGEKKKKREYILERIENEKRILKKD